MNQARSAHSAVWYHTLTHDQLLRKATYGPFSLPLICAGCGAELQCLESGLDWPPSVFFSLHHSLPAWWMSAGARDTAQHQSQAPYPSPLSEALPPWCSSQFKDYALSMLQLLWCSSRDIQLREPCLQSVMWLLGSCLSIYLITTTEQVGNECGWLIMYT